MNYSLTPDGADIKVVQLCVRMKRDPNIAKFLGDWDHLKSALFYAGAPAILVQSVEDLNPDRRSVEEYLVFSIVIDFLYRNGTLASFLSEMLRVVGRPKLPDQFSSHLAPLGLQWDRRTNQVRPIGTRPEAEQFLETELQQLLVKVDESLPNMLRGAWAAYYSDNPDRYRQAVSSCRELVSHVLRKLGTGTTRREKIQSILGSETKSRAVDAAAELVIAVCDVQSAQEHALADQPTALYALLETEHVLYFLLTHVHSLPK